MVQTFVAIFCFGSWLTNFLVGFLSSDKFLDCTTVSLVIPPVSYGITQISADNSKKLSFPCDFTSCASLTWLYYIKYTVLNRFPNQIFQRGILIVAAQVYLAYI